MANQNQPTEFDAVLGGQAPPPVEGVVLGGLDGVKRRLTSPVVEARVTAVSEAMNYADAGLESVIQTLKDESRQVHRSAYRLLRQRVEPQVKIALQEYKPWNLTERLRINGYPEHITTFANRRVEEFDPIAGITDPVGIAYAVRISSRWNEQEYITDKLERLLQDPQASSLEALVIGVWDGNIVDELIAASSQLKSLKAVFIGDITSDECEISWIRQSDISPVLAAYPKLEVLQVRGGEGLANFLSNGMKASLYLQPEGNIQVRILTDEPNNRYDYDCDEGYRYCCVSE